MTTKKPSIPDEAREILANHWSYYRKKFEAASEYKSQGEDIPKLEHRKWLWPVIAILTTGASIVEMLLDIKADVGSDIRDIKEELYTK